MIISSTHVKLKDFYLYCYFQSANSFSGLLFNDLYAASKFAVEGFCESLAVQAMKFNVKWVHRYSAELTRQTQREIHL